MPSSKVLKLIRAAHDMEEVEKDFLEALENPQTEKGKKYFDELEKKLIKKDKYFIKSILYFLKKVLTIENKGLFRICFIMERPNIAHLFEDF